MEHGQRHYLKIPERCFPYVVFIHNEYLLLCVRRLIAKVNIEMWKFSNFGTLEIHPTCSRRERIVSSF